MEDTKGKAFDTKLFKRLLQFAMPYRWQLYVAAISAILLSVFAALHPYYMKGAIDIGISQKNPEIQEAKKLSQMPTKGYLISLRVCLSWSSQS